MNCVMLWDGSGAPTLGFFKETRLPQNQILHNGPLMQNSHLEERESSLLIARMTEICRDIRQLKRISSLSSTLIFFPSLDYCYCCYYHDYYYYCLTLIPSRRVSSSERVNLDVRNLANQCHAP